MKKIVFCLFFQLMASNVLGYYIEGTIFGADRKPLYDALVKAINNERNEEGRAYTKKDGSYRLPFIPAGTYNLEVSHKDYKKQTFTVNISGGSQSVVYRDIFLDQLPTGPTVTKEKLVDIYLPLNSDINKGAWSQYSKGMKSYKKYNFKKAISHFQKSIKKDPTFSRAFTQLGISLLQQGMELEAIKNLKRGAELNPEDPLPLVELGKIYLNNKEVAQAESAFKKAMDLDRSLAETHYYLGKIYYLQTLWDKALLEFSIVMQKRPDKFPDVSALLGDVCLATKQYQEAQDHFRSYLRKNPNAPNANEVRTKISDLEERMLKDQ